MIESVQPERVELEAFRAAGCPSAYYECNRRYHDGHVIARGESVLERHLSEPASILDERASVEVGPDIVS